MKNQGTAVEQSHEYKSASVYVCQNIQLQILAFDDCEVKLCNKTIKREITIMTS